MNLLVLNHNILEGISNKSDFLIPALWKMMSF